MEYSEALKKFNYENIYDSMPAYDDPCWLWNAEEYQVDEGGYKPFITAFFEELKSYLPFYDNLQKLKNTITNKKLNIYHMEHMRTFLEYRTSVLEELVLKHVELFDAVKAFARKNILFDTLVDGYSIDVNRNDPKKSKILPLLPFRHQLEYIHEMEYGNKGIICTKGRRQGASVFATNDQRRGLIHRDNQAMAIANKSKLDTDRGKNDTMGNSSMSRLDLMMKHSIFVPVDYLDPKYNTPELIEEGTSSYRSYGPSLMVYLTSRLEGLVMGKGTGTGQGLHTIYLDEYDVYAHDNPNQEKTLFGAFQAGATRTFLYSTYRSVDYSMYRTVESNNTKIWKFTRLHWANNPTCNIDWYIWQCGKLDNVASDIAREHDIDPSLAIAGRIFPKLLDAVNILSEESLVEKLGDFWNEDIWERFIFADNGGTASQSYIKAFFNRSTLELVHYDATVIGDMSLTDLKHWFDEDGFRWKHPIYADRAIKANHTIKDHSTSHLLREEGWEVYLVDNKYISTVHDRMKNHIVAGHYYICNKNPWFVKQVKNYRTDDAGKVIKKGSHVMDACSYGFRFLFLTSSTERFKV